MKRGEIERCKSRKKAIAKVKMNYSADKSFDEHFNHEANDRGRATETEEGTDVTRPRRKKRVDWGVGRCGVRWMRRRCRRLIRFMRFEYVG